MGAKNSLKKKNAGLAETHEFSFKRVDEEFSKKEAGDLFLKPKYLFFAKEILAGKFCLESVDH